MSQPTWAALQRWRAATPDPTGRISTAVTAQALGERIRRLGVVAGIPLTGHSPRRGVATTLAQAGATEQELRAVGGWRSPAMVAEYCDSPNAARNAVTRLYGDDKPSEERPAVTAEQVDKYHALNHAMGAVWMAAKIARHHPDIVDLPAVEAARELVIELWPISSDPPPPCARPGCPGLLLQAARRPTDKWCSDACRRTLRNRSKATG